MFIALRLIARSSVALAVSIGYARAGTGRGMAGTSRSPDDDACGRIVRHPYFPSRSFKQILTAAVRVPGNAFWFPRPGIPGRVISVVVS
jgi:hypothetical protein